VVFGKHKIEFGYKNRGNFGQVLGQFWASVGAILGMCWGGFGSYLQQNKCGPREGFR